MPDQIGIGKFCSECKREKYYAKGLCSACYMQARRIKQGLPQGRRPLINPTTDEERRAQRRAIEKRYRERHPETIAAKEQKRRSTEEYKQKARERTAEWRKANPLVAEKARREYREKHRDEISEKQRLWAKANPEKRLASERRAEERRRGNRTRSRDKLYRECKGVCLICGQHVPESQFEIEHVIPLSKGGTGIKSNLAIAHKECNRSKGGKLHTPLGQIRLL